MPPTAAPGAVEGASLGGDGHQRVQAEPLAPGERVEAGGAEQWPTSGQRPTAVGGLADLGVGDAEQDVVRLGVGAPAERAVDVEARRRVARLQGATEPAGADDGEA